MNVRSLTSLTMLTHSPDFLASSCISSLTLLTNLSYKCKQYYLGARRPDMFMAPIDQEKEQVVISRRLTLAVVNNRRASRQVRQRTGGEPADGMLLSPSARGSFAAGGSIATNTGHSRNSARVREARHSIAFPGSEVEPENRLAPPIPGRRRESAWNVASGTSVAARPKRLRATLLEHEDEDIEWGL
jgi:hypothetical protein